MSDEVQIAIIVAVGPTLVGLFNAYKANQIHYLVNSRMTEVKADLAVALERVKSLEETLSKKIK